jgi:hypothetical protein
MATAAGIRSRRYPPTGSGRPPSRGRTGLTAGRVTAREARAPGMAAHAESKTLNKSHDKKYNAFIVNSALHIC